MPSTERHDTERCPPPHLLCSECGGVVEHVDRPATLFEKRLTGYRHAEPVCIAWREHRSVAIERDAFEEKKSGKTT